MVGLLGGSTLKVSSKGEGSTFSFDLTFKLGRKNKSEPAESDEVKIQSTTKTGYCILLVEDNKVNIKLATRLLEKMGHKVAVAENGKLGVEAASKDKFDLILMDMQMPVMDGLSATREIRRQEKEGAANSEPVLNIAMTANAMKGNREKCIEAGMDDYLTKPIKAELVNKVINQCLAER